MSGCRNTIPPLRRPTRREARIARDAERALQEAEKSARIRADVAIPVRQIRAGVDPGSVFHLSMSWTCDGADCAGAWSSGTARQWTPAQWDGDLHPNLVHFSGLTWAEIEAQLTGGKDRHRKHHSMPVEALWDEAQLRLIDLDQAEETIFRFRLGNRPRLWGFRRAAVFHVLWFDPKHEIYPTDPS